MPLLENNEGWQVCSAEESQAPQSEWNARASGSFHGHSEAQRLTVTCFGRDYQKLEQIPLEAQKSERQLRARIGLRQHRDAGQYKRPDSAGIIEFLATLNLK